MQRFHTLLVAATTALFLAATAGCGGGTAQAPPQTLVVWQTSVDVNDFEVESLQVEAIDDQVVLLTGVGHPNAPDGERRQLVGALDRVTGELLWVVDGGPDQTTAINTAIGEDVVVIANSAAGVVHVYSLSTGDSLWQMEGLERVAVHGDFVSVVDNEGERSGVYSASDGTWIHARTFTSAISDTRALVRDREADVTLFIDLASGQTIRTFEGPVHTRSRDAFATDEAIGLFNLTSGAIFAVEPASGEVLWERDSRGQTTLAQQGSVTVLTQDNRRDGGARFELVDNQTGAEIALVELGDEVETFHLLDDVVVAAEGGSEFWDSSDGGGAHFWVDRLVGYSTATGERLWDLDGFAEDTTVFVRDGGAGLGTTEESLAIGQATVGRGGPIEFRLFDVLTGTYVSELISAEATTTVFGNIGLLMDYDRSTDETTVSMFDGTAIVTVPGRARTTQAVDGLLTIWSVDFRSTSHHISAIEWTFEQ